MKNTQLLQFYNQITTWPKSQNELNELAKKVGLFLDMPLVVLVSNKPKEAVGLSISHAIQPENVNREKTAALFKFKLMDQKWDENNPIQYFTSSEIETPWPGFQCFNYFTSIRLIEHLAIGVGSTRVLTADEELMLLVLAKYLSDLFRIARLDSSLQIRNQFLSIASHELKTPLTSIYGILQLQERMLRLKGTQEANFPEQERHHNFLKMVIHQVERLNELIDDLLDISRIQNGRFMVEPSETDVALLLQELTQTRLNVIAQEAGVILQVDSIPKLTVRVDPVRMEEVITNLVMNAIRFSPEGGVVWIRLRDEDGAFRLTVRDQGPSIPIEDRERIFQPFERAQRTSRMGGLGLGLFISRQIALLHGGNVSLVESIPGKGNVFEAYFPTRGISTEVTLESL